MTTIDEALRILRDAVRIVSEEIGSGVVDDEYDEDKAIHVNVTPVSTMPCRHLEAPG